MTGGSNVYHSQNMCPRCAGVGSVVVGYYTTGGTERTRVTCDVCRGKGRQP